MELLQKIKNLRQKGDYCYALRKYVDRYTWAKKISEQFGEYYIDNTTDFNYGVCFSSILNITPIHAKFTSKEYREYLRENKVVYSISIEVSAIAPYACIRYSKRTSNPSPPSTVEVSYSPFCKEHGEIGEKVLQYLIQEKLTVLDEAVLTTVVPDVQLELRTENVQIYHCLFEDHY
jgi:hypothetical protein